jgi:hypothetical protein
MRSPNDRALRRPGSSGCRRWNICFRKPVETRGRKAKGVKAPCAMRSPPGGRTRDGPEGAGSEPRKAAKPARPPEIFASANEEGIPKLIAKKGENT